MKILITGGAGSLGSTLAKKLLGEHKVDIVDIKRKQEAWKLKGVLDQLNYYWKAQEDLNKDFLDKYDLIIPCACQADRPLGINAPRHTFQTNVNSLLHLLEELKRVKDPGLVIYPGSGTIFLGVPYEKQPITEENKPQPTNPYSASKYFAEELCRAFSRAYQLPIVILRSGVVLGRNMRLDISVAHFLIRAMSGKDIHVRSPHASRTPTHINDIFDGWMKVFEKYKEEPEEIVGETFHIVSGEEVEVIEMARTVREVVGKDIKLIEEEYEPGEKVGGKPAREYIVPEKAKEILGFEPKISFKEGIEKTKEYIEDLFGRDIVKV